MIKLLWTGVIMFAVTIIPPFNDCAKSAIAGSISADARRSIGLTSMPTDGATDWMTVNWPIPAATTGSRRTAACVTLGAISLSSSNHFPHKLVLKHHKAGGVGARLRQAFDKARPHRVRDDDKHDGNGVGGFQHDLCGGTATDDKHVRSKCNEFRCMLSCCGFIASAPAHLDLQIAPQRPTRVLEPFQKCRIARLSGRRIRPISLLNHRRVAHARPTARVPRAAKPPRRPPA